MPGDFPPGFLNYIGADDLIAQQPQMQQIPQLGAPPPLANMEGNAAYQNQVNNNLSIAQANQRSADQARMRQIAPIMTQGMTASANQMEQNYNEHDLRMQEIRSRADSLRSEIKTQMSQGGIDPVKYWRDMPTWGKIVAGIGLAVQGFLNPRGPNLVLNYIEREIERNIGTQQANQQQKGRLLEMEANQINADQANSYDILKTAEGKRAAMWDMVEQQFEMAKQQTSDAQAKAAADLGKAEAAQKAQDARMALATKIYDANQANYRARVAAGAQVQSAKIAQEGAMNRAVLGTARLPLEAYKATSDRMRAEAQTSKAGPREVQDPRTGQVMGHIRPQVNYDKFNRTIRAYVKIQDDIDDIQELTGDTNFWERRSDVLNLGNEKLHQAIGAYNKLLLDLVELKERGANIPETEVAYLKGQTGAGPDTWTTKDLSDRLRKAEEVYQRESNQYLNNNLIERSGGTGGNMNQPPVVVGDQDLMQGFNKAGSTNYGVPDDED